jgi:hypothetical protein
VWQCFDTPAQFQASGDDFEKLQSLLNKTLLQGLQPTWTQLNYGLTQLTLTFPSQIPVTIFGE